MVKKEKKDCGKIIKKIFKWTNILIGILVVILSIYQYSKMTTFDIKKPWTIFIPFYTIVFGIILALSELRM